MIVWVDGQCFQTGSRYRGIGRYAYELLRALVTEHSDLEIHISLNAALREEAIAAHKELTALVPQESIHLWHGIAQHGEVTGGYSAERRLSELALIHHVNCLNPDVSLSMSPFEGMGDLVVPLLPNPQLKAPLLGVFYDAIPIRYKDRYLQHPGALVAYNRRIEEHEGFDRLLCISDFAKQEAADLIGTDKGINISAGISSDFETILSKTLGARSIPDRKFLLYVGALDWRKNVAAISKAMAVLPKAISDDYDLVLVGDHPEHLLRAIVDEWCALGLDPHKLKPRGHISDADLVELYWNASALIQPSFMEGFGLTALEALMCNTPVIAARAGALPEVVKSEDLLFTPESPEDLAKKIEQLSNASRIEAIVANRRAEIADLYTWSNTASITAATLRHRAFKTTAKNDLASNRRLVKQQAKSFSGDRAAIAKTLALAEPIMEMPRRLIVDVTNTIKSEHITGIQRVVRKICQNMIAKPVHADQDFLITRDADGSGRYSTGGKLSLVSEPLSHHRIIPRAGDKVLMLDSSWHLFLEHKAFLLESRLRGADVIGCLYDMVPLKMPAFCNYGTPLAFRNWFISALETSNAFVCISKAVADELYTFLQDVDYPHPMKIGYWRLGADLSHSSPSQQIRKDTPRSVHPSFLMVGTLEPRKGHHVALDAFEKGWESGMDAHLTLVGTYGWGSDGLIERIRSHPEYNKRLRWYDSMGDEDLIALYGRSDALIASSYAEGFGLPIVEAGRFGIPIIASDIPVFKEVAKGAPTAHFFETGSPDSLLKELRKFAAGHNQISSKSKSALPDWPDWAESTEELLSVVVDGNWYKTFEPKNGNRFQLPSDLGRLNHKGPVDEDLRSHSLKLVSGSAAMLEDGSQRFFLSVTNQSQETWFGCGTEDGRFGVSLSFRTYDANGDLISGENARSNIVLALQPGDTHILPITVPADQILAGTAFIEAEMVQDAVAWWGSPLRIDALKAEQTSPQCSLAPH